MSAKLIVNEKVVKYIGTADVRIIRAADWKTIGINGPDVEWSRENSYSIPAESLPKAVLEYCQHDPELVVV